MQKLLLALLALGWLQAHAQIPTNNLIFGALYDGNLTTINTTSSTDVLTVPDTIAVQYVRGINNVNNTAIRFDSARGQSLNYYLSYNADYYSGISGVNTFPDVTFSVWVKPTGQAPNDRTYPAIFATNPHLAENFSMFLQPNTAQGATFPSNYRVAVALTRRSTEYVDPGDGLLVPVQRPYRDVIGFNTVEVDSNVWTHLVFRGKMQGNGSTYRMEYELFKNGVSAATGSSFYTKTFPFSSSYYELTDAIANPFSRLTVGFIALPQCCDLRMKGAIDNLRIYKSYLSDAEVAALYAEKNQNPTAVDPTSQIGFIVYPNPVAENLNLQMDQPLGGTLRILDLTGRVLQTTELTPALNHQVNVSQLTSGLYIAQLNGASLRFVKE